jgi:Flp pilus assembly pilin Flp
MGLRILKLKKENVQMLKLYSYYRNAITALERRFLKEESGQTMVEYVMLIVLVALAVFLMTPNIKSAIIKVFSNTSSALQ